MSNLIEQMYAHIDMWKKAEDNRAIFLTCYAMMTKNMLDAIERDAFEDGQWVADLTDVFARYYFDALTDYNNQGEPPVWTSVFETACRRKVHVLQNLLLGVNAHICYDLIFALADNIQEEWAVLSDEQRAMRYRDYSHVNEIIGTTIDAVQDEVIGTYDRNMTLVDFAFGRLDEWMIHTLITRWRQGVWDQAIAYVMASEGERPSIQEAYAEKAEQRSRAIQGERGILGIIDLF